MVRNLRASKRSCLGIKYQFGVRVPRNIAEAYKLNKENGNSLWTEAIDREVKLLRGDFECFRVGEESEITEYSKRSLYCGPLQSSLMGVIELDFALEDIRLGILRRIIIAELESSLSLQL